MSIPSARPPLASLLAGYAYFAAAGCVTLFVFPLYARLLGEQAWGNVALCLTLQGALLVIDCAYTPLLQRDIAAAADATRRREAFAHFLRRYVRLALLVFLAGQGALWLTRPVLDATVELGLRIVLWQFLFQFPNNVAMGYWHGRQRQVTASLRATVFLALRHGLALIALGVAGTAAPITVLAAFALVGTLECLMNHARVRRELDQEKDAPPAPAPSPAPADAPAPDLATDRAHHGHFGLAALIGVLSSQIDRLLLAPRLSPSDFGVYFLLSHLALALMHLLAPLQRAYLPRIVARADTAGEMRSMLIMSALLIALPCLLLALIAEPFLAWWLHATDLAARAAPTLRCMALAVALVACAGCVHAALLKRQRYRLQLLVNAAALTTQAVLLLWLAPTQGPLAGGLAWLAFGIFQALLLPLAGRRSARLC